MCMLLLGSFELREPLANDAIDLIGHLKLGPVGGRQSLREHRQDAKTRGQNGSYVEGMVRQKVEGVEQLGGEFHICDAVLRNIRK